MPPEDRQGLLLIRLGARVSADEATPAGALRRLRGARKQNARGVSLAYAPHSYRSVSASASVLLIGWRFFRVLGLQFRDRCAVPGTWYNVPGILVFTYW